MLIVDDTLGPSNRSFLERTSLPYLEKPIAPDEVRQVIRVILKDQGDPEARGPRCGP